MERKAKKNLIIILMIIFSLMMAAGIVFGASGYTIDENYALKEGTIGYTVTESAVSNSDVYHCEFTANAQTETLTVSKHVPTGNVYDNSNSVDVLIFTEGGEISLTKGDSALAENEKRTVADGLCYIYKNVEFASNAADGATIALNMACTIGNAYKVVVARYSNNNVYIGDYFSLKMLCDEQLHMVGGRNTFDDIETDSSGAVTVERNGYKMSESASGTFAETSSGTNVTSTFTVTSPLYASTAYLINVLYTGATEAVTLDGSKLTGAFSVGDKYITFKNFVLAGKETLIGGGAGVVFELSDTSISGGTTTYTYIDSEYGLVLSASSDNNFTFYKLDYENVDSLKILFIIDDFDIVPDLDTGKATYINIPCYINFLYSTVTLYCDFGITHAYGGAYELDAILSANHTYSIDNSPETDIFDFSISAPNGYYRAECMLETVGSDNYNFLKTTTKTVDGETVNCFTKNSDFIDLSVASTLADVVADAKAYISSYVPSYVYRDVLLPYAYNNYGLSYSYSVISGSSAFSENGDVTRAVTTTAVTLQANVYYGGELQGSVNKSFFVVGTDEAAVISAAANRLPTLLAFSSEIIGDVRYYSDKTELLAFFKELVAEEINSRFAIDLSGDGYLRLAVTYIENSAVKTAFTEKVEFMPGSGYTINFVDESNTPISVSAANLVNIILSLKPVIFQTGTENIVIRYAYDSGTSAYNSVQNVSVNLHISSLADRKAYLETLFEQVFIDGDTYESADVIWLSDFTVKRGSETVVNSPMGISGVTYNVYKVSTDDYEAFVGGTMTLSDLTDTENNNMTIDVNSSFGVVSGVMSASDTVFLSEGQSIIYVASVTIDGETAYYCRLLSIPESGIGGSRFTEYTAGNTFADYFNGLENNKLIDSVADVGGVSGNAHKFRSGANDITLTMTLTNSGETVYGTLSVGDYCAVVDSDTGTVGVCDGDEDYYQIDIDITKIPPINSAVQLEVVFSYNGSEISTQYYSFIIPGIYRKNATDTTDVEVADPRVYLCMIDQYSSFEGYLLVDGAKAEKEVFNCSALDITSTVAAFKARTDKPDYLVSLLSAAQTLIDNGTAVDLQGVHLLENTAKMIFDDNTILDLVPFGSFGNNHLQELSLSNCGLTSVSAPTVSGTMTVRTYLYSLTGLTSLDLSENALTSIADANGKGCFYRTLTTLNLDSQSDGTNRTLSSLDGVDGLPNLANLYIRHNKIDKFCLLKELKKITNIYLGDNQPTEISVKNSGDTLTYYGTHGEINVPVYVTLLDRGANIFTLSESGNVSTDNQIVYNDSSANVLISGGYAITSAQREGALLLNSVFYFQTQYDTVFIPVSVTYKDTTATSPTTYPITVVYTAIDHTVKSFTSTMVTKVSNDYYSLTVSGASNGDSVKVIISAAPSGTTVYTELVFKLIITA